MTTANCRPAPAREGAAVSPNGCYFALVKSTWQRQPMRIFLVALHANNPHCEPCRRSAVHFKFSQTSPFGQSCDAGSRSFSRSLSDVSNTDIIVRI